MWRRTGHIMKGMNRRWAFRLFVALAAALLVASPGSHRRMLTELQEIADRSGTENPYFDFDLLRRKQAELAALSPDASPATRYNLLFDTGRHEIQLGEIAKAVDHLEEAQRLWPQVAGGKSSGPLLQLAIAYLRKGETENCVSHHTGESCILPIRGKGIHQSRASVKNAIVYLTQLLGEKPQDLTARWLLNVAWMAAGGYPDQVPKKWLIPPQAFASEEKFPEFPDRAGEFGLNTFNRSGGVIVDDFDSDNLLDVITSDWSPKGPLRFFHNNGDRTFTERSKEAGFEGLMGGLNLVQADYDNDGDLDILVLRGAWLGQSGGHPKSLLANDGKGRFEDVTFAAGLGEARFPSANGSWADYDNDGDLDLFIGNEGFASQLFRNNGAGTFSEVSAAAGIRNTGIVKGVTWGDYDNDRFPDLYISNLGGHNRLYHNNRNGTFTDVAVQLGVTAPFKSFASWFWDYNNDGALDLFVASFERRVQDVAADYLGMPVFESEPMSLYEGDGKGHFRDVAAERNLTRITFGMGANFGDVDNDGFPDFYLGTGYPEYEALIPNLLFHNQGGRRFADVTGAARVGHLQKGHGVAFADLDNDGDQDLYVVLGGAYAGDGYWNVLFENPGFGNHWIGVRLRGVQSNRSGIGARIRVSIRDGGVTRSVYKWVNSGGSFGANPLRQQIGIGKAERVESLDVFWPATGKSQQMRNLPADQWIEIAEGATQ